VIPAWRLAGYLVVIGCAELTPDEVRAVAAAFRELAAMADTTTGGFSQVAGGVGRRERACPGFGA